MNRAALLAASVLLLLPAFALGDIGPKPLTSGSSPVVLGKDMEGIEVRMVEEKVDLLVSRTGERDYRLDVRAEFHMKNDGESATFETGFPIGRFRNFDAFSVEIDGESVDFDVASKKKGRSREYWYVWQATYPGSKLSRHVVTYSVKIVRHSVSPAYAGYVLHTGGPWKGPIGKATVTLRCGRGITFDHFTYFKPHRGGKREKREGDRVVWSHSNLEPTKDHDITFYWHDRKLEDDLARARREAETVWSARSSVVAHLGRRADLHLRDRLTPTEFAEYIEAVAALIDGVEEKDDRIVLPRTDANGDRSYVRSPQNILNWIESAAKIVEKYPKSNRARELLGVFMRIGERFLAGKLYAGDVRLELVWVGGSDTEEKRARRDKSIRKRRAEIASWIERARKALSVE